MPPRRCCECAAWLEMIQPGEGDGHRAVIVAVGNTARRAPHPRLDVGRGRPPGSPHCRRTGRGTLGRDSSRVDTKSDGRDPLERGSLRVARRAEGGGGLPGRACVGRCRHRRHTRHKDFITSPHGHHDSRVADYCRGGGSGGHPCTGDKPATAAVGGGLWHHHKQSKPTASQLPLAPVA